MPSACRLSQTLGANNLGVFVTLSLPSAIAKQSMKFAFFPLLAVTVLLASCATQLDPGAERVRIVSENQKASCESLGIVSTDQQLGLNKASNSMNKAINEVARRGGNAIFIVSTGTSGIDGAAVTAEALRCKY
jgi:hypothetical protein